MSPHDLSTTTGRVEFLTTADVHIEGRMPWSSNATFLVTLTCGEDLHQAIYKPLRGERPLWDFAPGLHRRELAAFVLSERLGYGVVPPTVVRDGPHGEGSLQWFVEADHAHHYFTILDARPDLHDQLRRIAVLDLLANNTDRKSGHCLIEPDIEAPEARVWGIDHGLCFAADDKLRTVIWEFAGDPISDELLDPVAELVEGIPEDLARLLDPPEVTALESRAGRLLRTRRFPREHGHHYPWPLV